MVDCLLLVVSCHVFQQRWDWQKLIEVKKPSILFVLGTAVSDTWPDGPGTCSTIAGKAA